MSHTKESQPVVGASTAANQIYQADSRNLDMIEDGARCRERPSRARNDATRQRLAAALRRRRREAMQHLSRPQPPAQQALSGVRDKPARYGLAASIGPLETLRAPENRNYPIVFLAGLMLARSGLSSLIAILALGPGDNLIQCHRLPLLTESSNERLALGKQRCQVVWDLAAADYIGATLDQPRFCISDRPSRDSAWRVGEEDQESISRSLTESHCAPDRLATEWKEDPMPGANDVACAIDTAVRARCYV